MNSNSALEELFSSEFLRWRYFEAFSTSFLLQLFVSTVICTIYKIIFYDFIWNPVLLIYYFADEIVRNSWLFRFILPFVCYVMLARIHIQSYSVTWWIPEKRLNYVSQFKLKKMIYSFTLILISTCLLKCYAFLINPELSSLTIECTVRKNEICINHQAVLILCIGVIFGVRLSLKYFLYNYKATQFPVTQPNFLVRLKSKLKARTLFESFNLFDISLGFLTFAYSSYLILGGTISYHIASIFGLAVDEESYSFWSVLAIIGDARFLVTLTICLGLLAFNLHCFFLNFQDIVLKKIELPICVEESPVIGSDIKVASNWTLNSGMVSSCELLQLLSFRHFRDLSINETVWGASYRSQIFAISQPGGHPRNWQSIIHPCLNLIRKFCDKLKNSSKNDEKTSQSSSSIPSSSTASLFQQEKHLHKNQPEQKARFNYKEKIAQVKEKIKMLPFICYLLSDLPDAKNRQIFSESQAVIWAIEGLSNIVAKSYTDDHYGVVQKNITDIFSTLVQTQLMVEKVGRGMNFRRASQTKQKYPNDLQLRKSLRLNLKSSLYILTSCFKESIREISVSEEIRNKLESYLAFQEG